MKGGLAVLLDLADELAREPAAPRRHLRVLRGRRGRRRAQRAAPPVRRTRPSWSPATSRSCSSRPAAGSRPAARARCTCGRRSTARGRTRPGRGWARNAIHRAAPVLGRARRATRPTTVDVDGLEYREALQVVRVEGGIANNVVPDRATFVVEPPLRAARTRRGRESPRCDELLDGADTIEVLQRVSRPRRRTSRNPLVAELVGAARPRGAAEAGLDRRRALRRARDPAFNFGPGDPELAHTAGELVDARLDRLRCACAATSSLRAWSVGASEAAQQRDDLAVDRDVGRVEDHVVHRRRSPAAARSCCAGAGTS